MTVSGLTNVFEIAAGFNHSLAVESDQTVWAWGYNNYGQIGDSTTVNRTTPVKTSGLSNIVAIAAGEYHNLALKSDGTVWSWGYNSHGQLGDGTTNNRATPVPVVGLSNVLAIAAGWAHSAALKADGTLVVWGSLPYGLNGDYSTFFSTVPITEEPSGVVNWEPPTITVQPFSQEVLDGDKVAFNVVAIGTNLTYQWNIDGSPIPSATASSYTMNCVHGDSQGNYTVTVGIGLNSVVSSNAVLTVDGGTGDSHMMAVWDCQFLQCNSSVMNQAGGTNSFHNVLFAGCGDAVNASTNSFAIAAEQVTAAVSHFYDSSNSPLSVSLTNSIVLGGLGSATLQNTSVNPSPTNFQGNWAGNYYLAANSPLHNSGTINVSSRLLTEFQKKTTYPPIAFPALMQLSGTMTLYPQAQRYTNGAPDQGYYYDALDYTAAGMVLNGGSIIVEPGTAIGFRMEYISQAKTWTYIGFDLQSSSSFVSQGTPNKPNFFVDIQSVQEQSIYPIMAAFLPDFIPDGNSSPPILNFRFSNLYVNYAGWLGLPSYQFWSGISLYGYEWSLDSDMYFNLQDCKIHGGQIDLGLPDGQEFSSNIFPDDYVYGAGALTWINNSFENVAISLIPTYYQWGLDDKGLNVDLSFSAINNLFQGGDWFILEPIPASAGNWTFENNLFDKVDFLQETNQPLDFDYNGYWPRQPSELQNIDDASQLLPATGGNLVGGHEQVLSNAPPYQVGPFGDFYLPTNTPLYNAGCATAGGVGLYHYTTRLNQFKEGNESSGHMVNIGVHYITATNGLPIDTDGDGIPDYVENWHGDGNYSIHTDSETDWTTQYTTSGVLDPTNSVYDNIDLSGDGLVGRVKKALGMNPFDHSNPLTLKQVITGDEPQIATFEVPITYGALTNIGEMKLYVDGSYVSWQGAYAGTNGNCWLQWNSIYNSPGQRLLQANLNINGMNIWGNTPNHNSFSAQGLASIFNSTNTMEFDDTYLDFDDSGATLYATTPACPDASYTIELKTPDGQHIKTITNSTSSGVISENWDLTDDNGNTVTNDEVDAFFNVTLLDPGSSSGKQRISKTGGLSDGDFTIACAFNNGTIARNEMWDCVEYPREDWGATLFSLDGHPHLRHVHVAAPNLTAYTELVGGVA